MQFSRRDFLKTALASTAACGLAGGGLAKDRASTDSIIDTHVYLGHWPHRRLPGDEPAGLLATLRNNNVSQAWAGSFDGLFHKDIAAVNQRLADACSRTGNGMLIPFGTINPTLPDWEEDIRRCQETFHMPGIRLHPNFHGYTLDDPRFVKLLDQFAVRGLVVQLVAWMEDERHLYLNPHTAQVDLKPLAEKMAARRQLQLVVANACRTAGDEVLRALLPTKQISFDFARATNGVELRRLIDKASRDRIVFGSCAPLRDFESMSSKLQDSRLADDDRQAIVWRNAERVFPARNDRGK